MGLAMNSRCELRHIALQVDALFGKMIIALSAMDNVETTIPISLICKLSILIPGNGRADKMEKHTLFPCRLGRIIMRSARPPDETGHVVVPGSLP